MSSLTILELKKLIETDPNLVIIDTRTEWEVKDGKIPKAVWMDVSSREFMQNVTTLPKDKTYCLYCASGGRTGMIVPFMEQCGFSKVFDLEGGIVSWMISGNPLEK
jgi:rhodanese-related sulfurtransferase